MREVISSHRTSYLGPNAFGLVGPLPNQELDMRSSQVIGVTDMNKKKSKLEVQLERVRDLECLILYFCVLRVVKQPLYEDPCIPGAFSWDKFQSCREFHKQWVSGEISHRGFNIGLEKRILDTREESMGIPAKLIEEVLGKYPPALGRGRVKLEDILPMILSKFHHEKAGQKKDFKTGKIKRTIKAKFYPKDTVRWKELLQNPELVQISERVKDIIKKWETIGFHWQQEVMEA